MRHAAALAMSALAAGSVTLAQDAAPARPWTDAAEFGLIMTTGNSEGTNYSFTNKFKYAWPNAELTCDAAALRTESTIRDIQNVGGIAQVTDTSKTTAATYGVAAKYRQNATERFFWYAGASWFQNFFAGIDDRYIVGGGVGYTFVKTEKHLLKGEIGVDLTREDPLGNPPPAELETNDFVGIRGYLGYEFKISEKSKLTEDMNFIENLDDSSAWRANSLTSITAALNSNLALKVSYLVNYSNEPPVKVIPGPIPALYQFEDTDTVLTAALVVNF